ncbi:Hsc70-interacting protein, putative [Entamoeba invadens IP1]|uniref:Hsc70-interacting protein, putative n=1 Tax=Entamoeba invadens IP1 TaxID=370355 RepID=A0A0A1UA78_ENTIV|nr:Hsc70-interacting protein, putative [Entamoeba invadens IP1]ELP91927.1 Hsc70-interacting protein, putative [Entamoeba invadens IP1]|eukprot:XP_004258698.1 Hsc70-interacting protein, putative [Entamoeba invadens IP1]
MENCGITKKQIHDLRLFVEFLKQNPQQLQNPELDFLKAYIESFGGVVPKSEDIPKPTKMEEEEVKHEEPPKEEPKHEEIKIEDPDLVEPDVLTPETLPLDKEVTEDQEVFAMTKRGEANEASNTGDLEKAVSLITEAILANPHVANFFAIRAQYYNKLRKPNAAIRDCTTAIKLNPDNAKAYKMRGQAYRLIGEYEKSVQDLHLGNRLDFDENTYELQKTVEKFVALKEKATHSQKPAPKQEKKPDEKPQRPAGCDGKGGCGCGHTCGGCKAGGCGCNNTNSYTQPNFQWTPKADATSNAAPNMGGMPGMDANSMFADLAKDPELMQALQDPDVLQKVQAAMANPAMMMSLMSDPKVGPVMTKLMQKFGQK